MARRSGRRRAPPALPTPPPFRAQRETEAESVGFIVCTVLGLTVEDVAAVHVGGWTDGDPDTITAAQAAIHTAARSLLADLADHDHTAEQVTEVQPG